MMQLLLGYTFMQQKCCCWSFQTWGRRDENDCRCCIKKNWNCLCTHARQAGRVFVCICVSYDISNPFPIEWCRKTFKALVTRSILQSVNQNSFNFKSWRIVFWLICTVLCTGYWDTVIGTNRTRELVIGVYKHNSFKTVVIVLILLLVS